MSREEISRNVLAWGEENQQTLENLSVGIVGAGKPGWLLSHALLCLGIGKLVIMDNASSDDGRSLVNGLAAQLRAAYPLSEIVGYHSLPLKSIIGNDIPELLFDLSPTPRASDLAESLATENGIGFYSGRCLQQTTTLSCGASDNQEQIEGPLCGLLAALCAEETRKRAFSLDPRDLPINEGDGLFVECGRNYAQLMESEIDSVVCRALAASARLGVEDCEKKGKVLLVGAGALGNVAGYLLADSVERMEIYDGDVVEASNLNRQFLFRGYEGEPKASTLAAQLSEHAPRAEFRGQDIMITEDVLSNLEPDYDLILSCVDDIAARIQLSRYAAEHKIPLLNGGTSSYSGTLETYLPGRTPCLDCQASLSQLLTGIEQDEDERGCALARPSVVMPNLAIGSMMAYAAQQILKKEYEPCRIRYDSFSPSRVYFKSESGSPRETCPYCSK